MVDKQEKIKKKRIDLDSTESDLTGFAGWLETFFRKNKTIAFFTPFPLIAIVYILSLALSLFPGYLIVSTIHDLTLNSNLMMRAFLICISISVSYLIFGLTLILVVPFFNKLFPLRVKNWRGNWYSVQTVPWYYHNALVQLVRYTFLDFVTPTPVNIFFYRAMGMKIGKNCVVNTSNISDPCLIELEDNVTIGGSATIFGHYAQGGFLVMAPVIIKKGATVGLKASIMGDVIIGEKVTVKPHSVLLPKTRLNKGDPQ